MDSSITKDYIKLLVQKEVSKASNPSGHGVQPKKKTVKKKVTKVKTDNQKAFSTKQKEVSEYYKTLDKNIPAKERQKLAWAHIKEKYSTNISNNSNGSTSDIIQQNQVDNESSQNLVV